MSTQHLADETVAACADGVLSGHARERAVRHLATCASCAQAVRVQREAAWALRTAPAPDLPLGLLDRLRTVPSDLGLPAVRAMPPVDAAPSAGPLAAAALVAHTRDTRPAQSGGRGPRHRSLPTP